MGRGRDKVILGSDIKNMSPAESSALMGAARVGRVKITGTAVVRGADGNARYDDPKRAGQYGEDRV